jgi:O-antigen/teichoic acid export membrane protein
MPQIAKNIKGGMTGQELTGSLVQPCRLNVLITGVVAFGFACIGQQFFEIIYGVEYRESWIYAIIIILPMFVNMTNGVIINVLDVLNKRHIRSYILMITTFLNIVLTIFGIKYIGMIGAAIATAISLIGQVILLNIYYEKKIGIQVGYLFRESYRGLLLPLVVACIIAWIVKSLIRTVVWQFLIGGTAFVVVFAVLYILLGLNECEKNKLRAIIHKQA